MTGWDFVWLGLGAASAAFALFLFVLLIGDWARGGLLNAIWRSVAIGVFGGLAYFLVNLSGVLG